MHSYIIKDGFFLFAGIVTFFIFLFVYPVTSSMCRGCRPEQAGRLGGRTGSLSEPSTGETLALIQPFTSSSIVCLKISFSSFWLHLQPLLSATQPLPFARSLIPCLFLFPLSPSQVVQEDQGQDKACGRSFGQVQCDRVLDYSSVQDTALSFT